MSNNLLLFLQRLGRGLRTPTSYPRKQAPRIQGQHLFITQRIALCKSLCNFQHFLRIQDKYFDDQTIKIKLKCSFLLYFNPPPSGLNLPFRWLQKALQCRSDLGDDVTRKVTSSNGSTFNQQINMIDVLSESNNRVTVDNQSWNEFKLRQL